MLNLTHFLPRLGQPLRWPYFVARFLGEGLPEGFTMTFVNSLKKAAEQKNANPSSVYGDVNKPTETVEDQLDEVEFCETADDHDELSFAEMYSRSRPK